jgi:hypothetical protein
VADDKKTLDDDKTIVDVRRPTAKPSDDDRTVVAPRNAPPVPPDEDRTVMAPRNVSPTAPPEDRTAVLTRQPAPADADRTVIRPAGAAMGASSDATAVRSAGAAAAAGAGYAIVCLSGPVKGQRFAISGVDATIGSAPDCSIRLPDTEPRHARLEVRPDGVDIQTLAGVVLLRGKNVSRTRLKSGDVLKIGAVVVRFVKAGEVFSSSYSEEELAGSGAPDVAALVRNPKVLALAAAVLVGGGVLMWWFSSSSGPVAVTQKTGPSAEEQRAKEVEGLLTSGEVLFNAGRLVAPADQPDTENAYRAFNRVIELDPGNDKARSWLERIDAELKKQAGAREAAEAQRQAREREARERTRRELAEKVNAILVQGDALFDRGAVAEPVGANALVKYRQALQVDPESSEAKERVHKAIYYYVARGDEFREKEDLWLALENYRKASRAAGSTDADVEARVHDTEARLRSVMGGVGTNLVVYKDDRGQLFVLDDIDKVPARYRDRAVEVRASDAKQGVSESGQ